MSVIAVEKALKHWVSGLSGRDADRPVSVAFSGGLDSTVLLHGLAALLPGRLQALHVNHGLQTDALCWGRHCEAQCKTLSVPFKQLDVIPDLQAGMGLEAAARQARYAALEACVPNGSIVVTGHHRSDQAETVLLALMRASGPAGLAAMPVSKPLGHAELHRPLLAISRNELEIYGQHHKLCWIEDPSNQDQQLRRNFLRHNIVPALQKVWPKAEHSLAQAAELQAESLGLLKELAAQDLAAAGFAAKGFRSVEGVSGYQASWLSVPALQSLSGARRKNVVRYWLEQQGLAVPQSQNWLAMGELFTERPGAMPVWHFSHAQVRRYNGFLLAFSALPEAPVPPITLPMKMDMPCSLPPGLGEYLIQWQGGLQETAELPSGLLELRFRRGGERFQPRPNSSHVTLKNALNERRVPPWQRDRTPLLFINQQLVAFGQHWLVESVDTGAIGEYLRDKAADATLADVLKIDWNPGKPNGWAAASPIEK